MASTEKGQRITKVNINMKIRSLNIFYWKNLREIRVPVSYRRESKHLKEKQRILAFLGQVNNLTELQFRLCNHQLHELIVKQ